MKPSELFGVYLGGQKNFNMSPIVKKEHDKLVKTDAIASNVNNINVNIIDKSIDKDEPKQIETVGDKHVDAIYPDLNVIPTNVQPNVPTINDYENQLMMLNNIIRAHELFYKIAIDNPLIVNKYMIAEQSTLKELIQILTGYDCQLKLDEDIKCCGRRTDYDVIEAIHILDANGKLIGDLKHNFNNVYTLIVSKQVSLKFTK